MNEPSLVGQMLRHLKDRDTVISCRGDDEEALRAFQGTVDGVQFFDRIGVIKLKPLKREHHTGRDYVDAVLWNILVDVRSPGYRDEQWRKVVLFKLYSRRDEGSLVLITLDSFANLLDEAKLFRVCEQLKEEGLAK